jgi:multiple sugar transport system permease protein
MLMIRKSSRPLDQKHKSILRSSQRRRKEHNITGYLFLLPWLTGLLIFTLGPMLVSFLLSFSRFDVLSAPRWIGAENYLILSQDTRLMTAIRVTLTYVFLSVPLKLVVALLFALLLNRGRTGVKLYRALYYMPSLLGGSVAIGILWREVFGIGGSVEQALGVFGIEGVGSWIAMPEHALLPLLLLAIWQFGVPMVIFLAGLKQIPQALYEAASVDGASNIRKFVHITFPLLTPLLFFNMVLQVINAFQAFTPTFIISDGSGGPSDSTLFFTLYIYQEGFGNFHMGYASAMAWLLLLVIALFTALAFLTARYWIYYQDEKK